LDESYPIQIVLLRDIPALELKSGRILAARAGRKKHEHSYYFRHTDGREYGLSSFEASRIRPVEET